MRIRNLSRGVTVVEQLQQADTLLTRFKGLMFMKALPDGKGLLLSPCNQVHTQFMRFPIDVIFLDQAGRVVAIEANMAPWRFGKLVRTAVSVLEVPSGTAARTGTVPGDLLILEP